MSVDAYTGPCVGVTEGLHYVIFHEGREVMTQHTAWDVLWTVSSPMSLDLVKSSIWLFSKENTIPN